MIKQSKARIFLAAERGTIETESFRAIETFVQGNVVAQKKIPFGALYRLSDDTLAAGTSLEQFADDNSYLILIPVTGAISVTGNGENEKIIGVGEIAVFDLDKNQLLKIGNPYEEGLINYLQVWLRRESGQSGPFVSSFELNKNINELLVVHDNHGGSFRILIGKFTGRSEFLYTMQGTRYGTFAYVIEGVFEVNGRLLHERDGLALWETSETDAEALSNNAILLMIELVL
jgi:quercetin 2,3-dioxygenase